MNKRRVLRRIAMLACTLILASSLIRIVGEHVAAQRDWQLNRSLSALYAKGESAAAQPEEQDQQIPEEPLPPIQEDFKALYEANPHLVGWLTAGQSIDLPVVQFDNEYYLAHDFFGRKDVNGTLFVNEANQIWPPDDVILIHGHNMKSGAQFGTLRRYERYDYAMRHPLVTFRTIRDPEEVPYVVIAAFNASMTEGNPEYFDIGRIRFDSGDEAAPQNAAEFEDYIASIQELSLWHGPAEARSGDKLLMLVTCSYYQDNGRFVLVCRRLREGETVEGVGAMFDEVGH